MARLNRASAAVAAMGGLMLGTVPGCWRGDSLPADDPSRLTITLRSPAFSDGGLIPKTYTCDGEGRSPPLEWSGVPDSTTSHQSCYRSLRRKASTHTRARCASGWKSSERSPV